MKVIPSIPAWLLASTLIPLLFAVTPGSAAPAGNAIDQPVLHPSIPFLDEAGKHVLESGQPYSPRMTCGNGNGSGCHDYDSISHAEHFEMGRDEADPDYGKKRGGWSHISAGGWMGGFNCMGPGIIAGKKPGKDSFLGDFGTAGLIKSCNACHTGGGFSEFDREGIRLDRKPAAAIAALDGDYFDAQPPAEGETPRPGFTTIPKPWDWKKSGVIENDCLMCHGDYSQLKIFESNSLNPAKAPLDYAEWSDNNDTPPAPFVAWWSTRNEHLLNNGFFREQATALLEFLSPKPGDPANTSLAHFERIDRGMELKLDAAGKPILHWHQAAFDANGKVQLPMRRFPANDNCWQCHGYILEQDRRGFWGFGEKARESNTEDFHKTDIHKGKSFTDDNGQTRVIDNCSACHTQGIYYRPGYANVDLDASHHFPKGHSDIDVRRDLDNRPGPKSCEYCHDTAKNRANPSGNLPIVDVHREVWKHNGDMAGYSADSLTRITQTHMDTVGCQTCHINKLKGFDGSDLPTFYRYRQAEDGRLKIVPTIETYQFRYYWKDKNSGRVLTRDELFTAYTAGQDPDGNPAGILVDPETGGRFVLPGEWRIPFQPWYDTFPKDQIYGATRALKRVYDRYLRSQGYANPDVQLVWLVSNSYLVSHNTRPSPDAVQCADCHAKKQNGAFSSLVSTTGLLGAGNVKVLTEHADKRLVDEGVVVLSEPWFKVTDDNKIVANMEDLLNYSRSDPSLSALKSETATAFAGEWARSPLDLALRRMGITDAGEQQWLGLELGTPDLFEFTLEAADRRLKAVALASAPSLVSERLFPGYRLDVAVADLGVDDRNRINTAGLGTPASDAYTLRMLDPAKREAADFLGQRVLVKLPYRGANTDPARIRLLSREGGRWADSGIRPLRVTPPETVAGINLPGGLDLSDPAAGGHVVFAVDRPFQVLALADVPAGAAAATGGAAGATGSGSAPKGSDAGAAGTATDPSAWGSVQPQSSCLSAKCKRKLAAARVTLKARARAARKATAEAQAAAARAARQGLDTAAQSRLSAIATRKTARADRLLAAYAQAAASVQGLRD